MCASDWKRRPHARSCARSYGAPSRATTPKPQARASRPTPSLNCCGTLPLHSRPRQHAVQLGDDPWRPERREHPLLGRVLKVPAQPGWYQDVRVEDGADRRPRYRCHGNRLGRAAESCSISSSLRPSGTPNSALTSCSLSAARIARTRSLSRTRSTSASGIMVRLPRRTLAKNPLRHHSFTVLMERGWLAVGGPRKLDGTLYAASAVGAFDNRANV